jgi:hypothetical protein
MKTDSQHLADDLYRRRVAKAKAMTMEDRLTASLQLMEDTRPMVRAGIEALHPDADEAEVTRLLLERLRRLRKVSDAGLFHPAPAAAA